MDYCSFSLLHINVQGLMNKINLFDAYLQSKNNCFNVLCISEHWLLNNLEEVGCVRVGGYCVADIFSRSNHRRGGSLIMVRDGLKFKINNKVKSYSREIDCEISAVYLNEFGTHCISIYRSPNGSFANFLTSMEGVLRLCLRERVILAGDFNIKFNTADGFTLQFVDLLRSFGFTQTIHTGTRNNNCIDNIFINFNTDNYTAFVDDLNFSDHYGQILRFPFENPVQSSNVLTCRPTTELGKLNFFNIISNTDWFLVISDSSSFPDRFSMFHNHVVNSFKSAFPIRNIKFQKPISQNNWYNEELRSMRETMRYLGDMYKKYQTDYLKTAFKNYRSLYNKTVKDAKIRCNDNYILQSSNKSKAMWNLINSRRSSLSTVRAADCEISPEEFNTYFQNVAKDLISGLSNYTSSDYVVSSVPDSVAFDFGGVSLNEVRDAINSLKNSDSKDIYGLSVNILKLIKNEIISPLTKLINLSIQTCIFPDELKLAAVLPLYKKGDVKEPGNYRPISILPVVSKIFEKLMKSKIASFFENNSLFCVEQFGFRAGRSTCGALLDFVEFSVACFESGDFAGAVFCDISRAFDCIDHNLLLQKLKSYGFSVNAVSYIQSYLSNRFQVVRVAGAESMKLPINSGVPQGSILGPLLFLIYINDLPKHINAEKCILFADDTTLLTRGRDQREVLDRADVLKGDTLNWFASNNLALNESKTQTVLFSMRDCGLPSEGVKFLGLHVDRKLRWHEHGDAVAGKLNKALFLMRNLSLSVSQNVLRTTYFSLFHSVMVYGILIWGHASCSDRIFGIQRKAVRVLDNIGYRADCRTAFIKHKILTFPSQYIYSCLLHIRANSSNYPKNSDFHLYPTRGKELYSIPHLRLTSSQMGSNYICIKLFNALPLTIKRLEFIPFKAAIKKLLIEKAFYSLNEYFEYFNEI